MGWARAVDIDCAPGLRCFSRDNYLKVPGCQVGGLRDIYKSDYCTSTPYVVKWVGRRQLTHASEHHRLQSLRFGPGGIGCVDDTDVRAPLPRILITLNP